MNAASPLPPILDAAALAALLQEREGPDLHLLDVRWSLDGSKGVHTYREGHLPGAVYLDLPTELSDPTRVGRGRHPLPTPEGFAATLRRAGVTTGSRVVAYDDTSGTAAARLVWMLRVIGHDAALLDGGLAAWEGELSTEDPAVAEGDVPARPWPDTRIASVEEVAAGTAQVVDARAAERYRGDVEPLDPRAGHVPGALNLPFAGNLGEDGRFLEPAALRQRFADHGLDLEAETVVYCGSGVTAAHEVLAMDHAGIAGVRLFPGSWSQWSAEESRPVATGPRP